MNTLNLNPKTAHFLLELVQGLGLVATVASLPGLSAVVPWVGIAGAVAAGAASIVKTNILGNIPAAPATPPSNPPTP